MTTFHYDPRTTGAMAMATDNPKMVFGWHSISCLCESCLYTDALVCFFGRPNYRVDLKGITP